MLLAPDKMHDWIVVFMTAEGILTIALLLWARFELVDKGEKRRSMCPLSGCFVWRSARVIHVEVVHSLVGSISLFLGSQQMLSRFRKIPSSTPHHLSSSITLLYINGDSNAQPPCWQSWSVAENPDILPSIISKSAIVTASLICWGQHFKSWSRQMPSGYNVHRKISCRASHGSRYVWSRDE